MNARPSFPPGAGGRRPARMHRRDQEFLPAALEILDTPPSPVHVALLWLICIFAVAALAWSYFGRIDIVAVAQGKIQPTGRVKIVQPLEPGRVVEVKVENGRRVAVGDPLVVFDSAEADADVRGLRAAFEAASAEVARRRTALGAIEVRRIDPLPAIDFPDGIAESIRSREAIVLAGDLRQLDASVGALRAQQRQRALERDALTATVAAREGLVSTLQQRVDMRSTLERGGAGTMAVVIDALEGLKTQQATLATERGELAESGAAVETLGREIEKTIASFTADYAQKLAEAERTSDDIAERLAKAEARRSRTVLASPIAGRVSGLTLTTLGQVVGAGEEVMRIVPDDVGIEIECYILNRDIGFVRPGQEAVVKIESLPSTRYGTIQATLVRVAGDAIPQPDAAEAEGNPTRAPRTTRGLACGERVQNLVFPATLRPSADAVVADGATVPLSPGMTVTVEIKTGSRRILEYVFSPLVEVAGRALKER